MGVSSVPSDASADRDTLGEIELCNGFKRRNYMKFFQSQINDSVFLFVNSSNLTLQIVIQPDLFDQFELCFEPVNMLFFGL